MTKGSDWLLRLLLPLTAVLLAMPAAGGELGPKVQRLMVQSAPTQRLPVIVTLRDAVDLAPFVAHGPRVRAMGAAERRAHRAVLIRALRDRAAAGQQPIRELLRLQGEPEPRDLWLINGLALNAAPALIEELARRPEVASIAYDEVIQLPRVIKSADGNLNAIEDNIDLVGAPVLWNAGFTGQGVTVAVVDSGVDLQHPDLISRWRGGTNSWFNAVAANCANPAVTCATSCDTNTTVPCDYLDAQDVAHGTGVAGVLVGGNAGGTAIGVAPGARWIAAKIFDSADNAPVSVIHAAFQWLLDPDGNPATDDAPDVVNSSWGFEGNPDLCLTEFRGDIQALKAAGIAVVFAAGNTGPDPASSVSPGNYPESFAVGAVGTPQSSTTVSSFSARGPSSCDGSVYPEAVAPGLQIRTADLSFGGIPGSYLNLSGTSFSAPHAAGVMALLLSAFPGISVAELENALTQSAVDLGVPGADNDYGFGLIDAVAAFDFLAAEPNITVTDSAAPQTDGILAFGHVPPGTSAGGSVQVRNAGSADLTLAGVDVSGVSVPFAVTADPCSGAVLVPGQSCTLTLNFAPTVLGTFGGSLAILSDDPDQPAVAVTLSGIGNTPPVAPQPVAPAGGALTGTTVTFRWLPASDADGDGISQFLVVSAHADFTAAETFPVDPVAPLAFGAAGLLAGALAVRRRRRLVVLLLAAGLALGMYACGGGGSSSAPPEETPSMTLTGFTPGVTYFWKMRAEDSRGAVTESAVRSFTVE